MSGIPRIIHRIWFGSAPPAVYLEYDRAWRALYPDWEFRYWGNAEGRTFPLANRACFDRAWRLDQKSDILRYELLLLHGGVYVDYDIDPLRPMDEALAGVDCFVCQWRGELLNNSCLGAAPGHPFVAALVQRLPASMTHHRPGRVSRQTGPHFLTRVFRQWRADPLRPPVTVFPSASFHPLTPRQSDRRWNAREAPGAFGIHRWGSRRFGHPRVPGGRLPA